MQIISKNSAVAEAAAGVALLADVREPEEYKGLHLNEAVNLPLSGFSVDQFEPYKEQAIHLICYSGRRARLVGEKLKRAGFENISVLDTHMSALEGDLSLSNGWSVDRQFRLTLGILLAAFLTAYFLGYPGWIVIPFILSLGLTITSLIDRCFMRMAIAKLPWNRGKSG